MGDYIRRRLRVLSPLLPLTACGLERDYEAYQQAADTTTRTTGSETGPETAIDGSSGDIIPDPGASSSTTHEPPDPGTSTEATGSETTTSTTLDLTTGAPAAICGDGVVDDGEECDEPGEAHCRQCVRDRLVFVTSEVLVGDFAGSADLDYWCDHLAGLSGLRTDQQVSFRAWLSTSEGSAAERLHHSRGRYVLRDGSVFADSWEAIVAGELQHPLNITELNTVRNISVWTETLPDGSAIPGASYCQDWSASEFGLRATWGRSNYVDGRWTQWADDEVNPTECGAMRGLYCFEQG